MFKGALFSAVLMLAGSAASAAIIYEPIQYQYGQGSNTYYYGGRHPEVVAAAQHRAYALRYSDPNHQTNDFITRTDRTPAVYSDAAPYINLSVYGYRPTD